MPLVRPILVFEKDRSVLASLQFALALEGFRVIDGESAEADPRRAGCLIIEQRSGSGDGLARLAQLRRQGCGAPAILLSTNPTRSIVDRARAAGAELVEKPLLNDCLTRALHKVLCQEEAA